MYIKIDLHSAECKSHGRNIETQGYPLLASTSCEFVASVALQRVFLLFFIPFGLQIFYSINIFSVYFKNLFLNIVDNGRK